MASRAQLKIINDLLKIEGMAVDNYQLVLDFGYVIYLKSQRAETECHNCGSLTEKLHLLGATHCWAGPPPSAEVPSA